MPPWKYFAASAVLLLCLSSVRAVPLSEEFEGPFPPDRWLTFRTGNGTGVWQRSATRDAAWGYSAESVSESAHPSANACHWLVTPQLLPDASSAQLSFHLRLLSLSFAGTDTVDILLSIAGSEPSDFSQRIATLKSGPNGDFGAQFTRFDLNLSAFSGLPVRIAFVRSAHNFGKTIVQLDGVRGCNLISVPAPPEQPDPPDGATAVDVAARLNWTLGAGTASVEAYLSRNRQDVESFASIARVLSGKRLDSFRPQANLLSNSQYYWRVVAVNDAGQTAGPVWSFSTGVGPLSGSYRIGGIGSDFATLGAALSALSSQGISGPTTISLTAGTYDGPITLAAIPGASANSRLTIRKAYGEGAVTLRAASVNDTNTVTLAGARYVTFDSIGFAAEGGATRHCVGFSGGSSHVIIRNGTLCGPGVTVANSDLIRVQGGQCDSNLFENLRLSRAIEGIRLSAAGSVSAGNIVRRCVIDSVRKGIVLIRQRGCRIQENDITLNAGASDEVDGVYIGTTLPQDSIFVHGNRIHGATTSAVYAVGIRVRTDSATAVVRAYNNFIYDFRNTSSSQVRALFVSSGICEFYSNSILINNVAATGTTYGICIWSTGASGRTVIKNNLLVNREATNTSYNIFVASNTAEFSSDYNIFQGTGSGYRLGYFGANQTTLSQWQSVTGQDARSLEGDPGFVSDTDLHLQPSNGLSHQNGCVIPGVGDDIDGDPRRVPPDRGADEYEHTAPPSDFALTDFIGLTASYAAGSTVPIRIAVLNRGSASQSNVPLRLYYDGVAAGEVLVSLTPLAVDTVVISWPVPAVLSTGVLSARSFLSGDAVSANDSLAAIVTVVAPPLIGTYSIGPAGGDYPNFAAAVTDLVERGVAGPVLYLVEPGVYREQVTIPPIAGASESNSITFVSSDPELHPVIISDVPPATLMLAGSDYVSFQRIDFTAMLPNQIAIKLTSGACRNVFSEANVTGSSVQQGSACGVRVEGGGNHGNEFRYLYVSSATTGMRLSGTALAPDSSTLIKFCTIASVNTGIRCEYQAGGRVCSSTISVGRPGTTDTCCGIWIGPQTAGSGMIVERNTIAGGVSAGGLTGIYSAPGTGQALVVNNFISRLNGTGSGTTYGILAAGGATNALFNSLWMTDVSGSGDVYAIADTSVTGILTALNNAVVVSESANRAWCIARIAGTLVADYNVYYYRGIPENPLYSLGRNGIVNHITLTQWQNGTGQDVHSYYADPDFVSETDLHVRTGGGVLNGRGVAVPEVSLDFDGEERGNPPDIGADEYLYRAPARDFALSWVSHYAGRFIADSTYSFALRVVNAGQERGSDVPVGLLFDGQLQALEMVMLEPGQSDTVTLRWTVPGLDLAFDTLSGFCALPGDVDRSNDTVRVAVEIVGHPMAGSYTVGGTGSDFSTLSEAFRHLTIRGVSAPVDLTLRSGTYSESLSIAPIPGADSLTTVTVRGDTSGGTLPLLTAAAGSAVLILNGASHLNFECLSFAATGSCTSAVALRRGASDNLIRNGVLRGADSSKVWSTGVKIAGDGCSRNRFDGLQVSRAFTGILFEPALGSVRGSDNVVANCAITRTRIGVSVSSQTGIVIERCDIVPGYNTTLAAVCYGIYLGSLGAGGSARITGNRIYGFADRSNSITNRAAGIYSVAGGEAQVLISNNFIYDFSRITRLKISAIYLSSGIHEVFYNSVLLNDVSTANEIAAIVISTGNRHTILNNILVSREDDDVSYGILQSSTDTLSIDYNDLYGPAGAFVVGKVGSVLYPTLQNWQARGHDVHGLSADPGFVSDIDLHVNPLSHVVDGRALPLLQVTSDIDGEPRLVNSPDVGADEYLSLLTAEAVLNLTIQWRPDSLVFHWSPSGAKSVYTLYADTSANVTPCPATWIAETADTLLSVPNSPEAMRRFFVICASVAPQPHSQPPQQTPDAPSSSTGTRKR